jgi:exodeoxyribonuclease V beta subunit
MSSPDEFINGTGPHLVEASAGTGKTTWMVKTAVRFLLNDPSLARLGKPERLLAVTFTRAATAELKERLREQLNRVQLIFAGAECKDHEEWIPALRERNGERAEVALQHALGSLDKLAVTTIHSFFKGVLEEFAFECGVPMGLTFLEDVSPYIETALEDEWRTISWAPGVESHLLFNGGVALEQGSLLRQVQRVRGAIGAERPPRVDRGVLFTGTLSTLDAVIAGFDATQLRAYHASITWNKGAPTLTDIDDLERAVAEHTSARPLPVKLLGQWTTAAISETASGRGKGNRPKALAEPFLALCDAAVASATVAAQAFEQDVVLSIVERVEHAMTRDRVAGFDEQVGMLVTALEDPIRGAILRQALSERYDAVLVDEFQDTDWAQWRIFASTFSEKPLILVGDPKQSIYAFRGADITAYRAAREAAAGRVVKLDTNYRSDTGLVEATEALFTQNNEPFAVGKAILDFDRVKAKRESVSLSDPRGRPLVLTELETSTADRRDSGAIWQTANEIARLLSDGTIEARDDADAEPRPLRAKDIVVLVTANHQVAPLIRALKTRGVSAISGATGDIADSVVWNDLLLIIDAIERPADSRVVRRALATEFGGWTAAQLATLSSDNPRWREVIERLTGARREWSSYGALGALTSLANDWHSISHLAKSGDGERHLTDLRHMVTLLQQAEREGCRTPAQLRHWARRFADTNYTSRDARQLHLESDREAVLIATVHAAKGLEWPIVFCPYLWKLTARDAEMPRIARFKDGTRRVTFGEELLAGEIPPDEPLSENLRLAYVALTRAKWRTYVSVARPEKETDTPNVLSYLLGSKTPDDLAAEYPELIAAGIAEGPVGAAVPLNTMSPDDISARDAGIGYTQRQSWTVTSYTRITSSLKHGDDADDAPVLDPVEVAVDPTLIGTALPGSANTGDALHALFEMFDYTRLTEPNALEAAIDAILTRYSLPSANPSVEARRAAREFVLRMSQNALAHPIPGADIPLSAVTLDQSFREWRFQMPTAGVSAKAIANVLTAHGATWLADYARALARSGQHEVDGILTGSVDLVCVMNDRWWIVDWKSNTLGPTTASYDEEGCRRAMMREHFVLQYHIYIVALHRFLRSRLGARYDYQRDFGGVGYAFLRGLAVGAPAWFTDRPSHALVEALDLVIGGHAS